MKAIEDQRSKIQDRSPLNLIRDRRYKTIELYEHAEALRFYGHSQMADLYEAEADAQCVAAKIASASFIAWRKRREAWAKN